MRVSIKRNNKSLKKKSIINKKSIKGGFVRSGLRIKLKKSNNKRLSKNKFNNKRLSKNKFNKKKTLRNKSLKNKSIKKRKMKGGFVRAGSFVKLG
jgi:hypothetical protein